jgi:DNA-nicking Smr family endonuclease
MGAGGVLRAQVPRWLNEPANRARVLAFDYAQPKHGGLGAIYVLLRRKKGG